MIRLDEIRLNTPRHTRENISPPFLAPPPNGLPEALAEHLNGTECLLRRLETLIRTSTFSFAEGNALETERLIGEGGALLEEWQRSSMSLDALLAAARRAEQQEIVAYGLLHLWAKLLEQASQTGLFELVRPWQEMSQRSNDGNGHGQDTTFQKSRRVTFQSRRTNN